MKTDFHKMPWSPSPVLINSAAIEFVDRYKYLVIITDDTLTFNVNTDMVCKEAQQRSYFLGKLKMFSVDRKIRSLFISLIESVVAFPMIAWFGNLSIQNKNRLNNIIKMAKK